MFFLHDEYGIYSIVELPNKSTCNDYFGCEGIKRNVPNDFFDLSWLIFSKHTQLSNCGDVLFLQGQTLYFVVFLRLFSALVHVMCSIKRVW